MPLVSFVFSSTHTQPPVLSDCFLRAGSLTIPFLLAPLPSAPAVQGEPIRCPPPQDALLPGLSLLQHLPVSEAFPSPNVHQSLGIRCRTETSRRFHFEVWDSNRHKINISRGRLHTQDSRWTWLTWPLWSWRTNSSREVAGNLWHPPGRALLSVLKEWTVIRQKIGIFVSSRLAQKIHKLQSLKNKRSCLWISYEISLECLKVNQHAS